MRRVSRTERVAWLIPSLGALDFDPLSLIASSAIIGKVLQGTFSYGDLREMPYVDFAFLEREMRKVKDAGQE